MIDTIELTILNLDKYEQNRAFFLAQKSGGNLTVLSSDAALPSTSHSWVRYNIFNDSDNIVPFVGRTSVRHPSSEYKIAILPNFAHGTVRLNVSIPKFIFGTNIMQFVDYHNINEYTTYKLLRKFIPYFFAFLPQKIDKEDIQVNRIDLCINQLFNSEHDSKAYLEDIYNNMKSVVNKPQNITRYGNGSVAYKTTNGYYKVYHKGDEFAIQDKLEILKKRSDYDIKYLQQIADRTLRYEVTLRNANFKQLFKSEAARYIFPNEIVYRDSNWIPKGFNFSECHDYIKFNDEMFAYCWNKFWNFTKKIQTKSYEKKEAIMQAVRDNVTLNNMIKAKQIKEVGLIETVMLSYSIDIKDLYKAGYMKQSTYYDKKKMLASIGLKTFNNSTEIAIPAIGYYDYQANLGHYHSIVL